MTFNERRAHRKRSAVIGILTCGALLGAFVVTGSELAAAQTAALPSAPVSSIDTLTAATLGDAQLAAAARGWRVEALSERTSYDSTWANPDGTFTTESSLGPVRVADDRQETGWRDVDFDLVANADGTVGPKSGFLPITLSGAATAREVAETGVVSVDAGDEANVAFGWDGALPSPVLDGATATYPNVRKNIDLVVELTASGFEQYFIVKKRPTASQSLDLELPVASDGLELDKQPDGSIDLTDEHNDVAATIPTPYMWDSRTDAVSGLPSNVTELDTTIGDDNTIELDPDASFLNDPATQYPVTIDPAVSNGVAYDTFVRSDFPTTDYHDSTELQIGTYNSGTTKARSTLNFDSDAWQGTTISDAQLKLYLFHSYSCDPAPIRVYRSDKATLSTDWGNQPYINTDYTMSYSTAKGYSSACEAGYVTLTVTDIAQSLAGNESTTVAFGLRASETANAGWKRFRSSNATSGSPSLSVTYNTAPNTSATPTIEPSEVVSGISRTPELAPSLISHASDADGGNTQIKFHVSTSSTFASIYATCTTDPVPEGEDASCVPSIPLANNTTYYVRSKGYDGKVNSVAYSPTTTMRTVNVAPDAPTIDTALPASDVTSATWVVGSDPNIGVVATDPNEGEVNVSFELYKQPYDDNVSQTVEYCSASGYSGDVVQCSFTGLAPGNFYYVRAKVSDGYLESAWSALQPLAADPSVVLEFPVTEVTKPFDHPVSVEDAVDVMESTDYIVNGYQISNRDIAGEWHPEPGETAEDFAAKFEADYGTEPQIDAVMVDANVTTAARTTSLIDDSPITTARPELDAPLADGPEITEFNTSMDALEEESAEEPEEPAAVSGERATDRGNGQWRPSKAKMKVGKATNPNGAKKVDFTEYYYWDGKNEAPERLDPNWGLEFEVDTWSRATTFPSNAVRCDDNITIIGNYGACNPFGANCTHAESYGAPVAKNRNYTYTVYAGAIGNTDEKWIYKLGAYADTNDLWDNCRRNSISIGIANPENIRAVTPGSKARRLYIHVRAPKGTESSGRLGSRIDTVERNTCRVSPSNVKRTDCMGAVASYRYYGPGTRKERPILNYTRNWNVPTKCWKSEEYGLTDPKRSPSSQCPNTGW